MKCGECGKRIDKKAHLAQRCTHCGKYRPDEVWKKAVKRPYNPDERM